MARSSLLAAFLILALAASSTVDAIRLGRFTLSSGTTSRSSRFLVDQTVKPTTNAPLLSSLNANPIPNRYVVVLKPEADLQMHTLWVNEFITLSQRFKTERKGDEVMSQVKHVFDFNGAFKGYSGVFDEHTVQKLRQSDDVEFVERDQTMNIVNVEHDAPWGLVRISHREVPSTSSDTDYLYPKEAGSGVTAYVIDTGVNIDHVDFEGRAVWGATIPEGDADIDGNGHGTHVAGSVAGKKYGVAKKAKIKAVKVLRSNGSGTLADVVKGIEWAVIDHKKRLQEAADLKKKSKVKSVANMSLGGGRSRALDRAVDAAVAAGIHFAVAAGNSGDDACDYSPAASQRAVTVGATTASDSMAWFSNHGECVDIFAPGHQITSAWIGSKVATNTISGTSMASPHVAGALALLLSEPQYENMTPKELKDVLIELSSKDIITNIPTWAGGVNRLLYTDPPANLTSSKFY